MKNLSILIATLFLLSSCFGKKNEIADEVSKALGNTPLSAQTMEVDENGLSKASAILKTVHGNITIHFYPKEAPNTVTRIIQLIQKGFYNGVIFHRVVPDFVIQGGDPTGTGMGGSGQNLKAEFNQRQHVLGTVAMARSQSPDSADSQFYIAMSTLPHLDGKYTVFGKVRKGLDIISKVTKGDKILSFTIQK